MTLSATFYIGRCLPQQGTPTVVLLQMNLLRDNPTERNDIIKGVHTGEDTTFKNTPLPGFNQQFKIILM